MDLRGQLLSLYRLQVSLPVALDMGSGGLALTGPADALCANMTETVSLLEFSVQGARRFPMNGPNSTRTVPRDGSPERSAGLPSRGTVPVADPEVVARASRRRFSADYKLRVVQEADACTLPGQIGSLLRREGIYSSILAAWRRQLRRHGVDGLPARTRGPAPKARPSSRELLLERENRALQKRLAKAEAVILFQKRVHEVLAIPLKIHETEGDD